MPIEFIDQYHLAMSRIHLSYKDLLLVPYEDDFCEIKSRQDPDISANFWLEDTLKIPLIASPMDTICGESMLDCLYNAGSLGIHTRYIGDENEQIKQLKAIKNLIAKGHKYIACATGVKDDVEKKTMALCDAGVNYICLDTANGNHIFTRDALKVMDKVRQKYKVAVIAGNVATGKSARRLAEHGATHVRVGFGSGGICSTRIVTGMGVPQLTAICDTVECFQDDKLFNDCKIISDGGIRNTGDIIKALWAGADFVMCGFLFSGCNECPNFNSENENQIYRGMASREVNNRKDVASEGVPIKVKRKGSAKDIVDECAGAIRSAFSYGSSYNINEFRNKVKAIRVSTLTNEETETIRSL